MLIVDKTGTLTEGTGVPEGGRGAGFSEDEVLRLAASLDQGSEHPLAHSIVAAASGRGLALSKAEDFDSSPDRRERPRGGQSWRWATWR